MRVLESFSSVWSFPYPDDSLDSLSEDGLPKHLIINTPNSLVDSKVAEIAFETIQNKPLDISLRYAMKYADGFILKSINPLIQALKQTDVAEEFDCPSELFDPFFDCIINPISKDKREKVENYFFSKVCQLIHKRVFQILDDNFPDVKNFVGVLHEKSFFIFSKIMTAHVGNIQLSKYEIKNYYENSYCSTDIDAVCEVRLRLIRKTVVFIDAYLAPYLKGEIKIDERTVLIEELYAFLKKELKEIPYSKNQIELHAFHYYVEKIARFVFEEWVRRFQSFPTPEEFNKESTWHFLCFKQIVHALFNAIEVNFPLFVWSIDDLTSLMKEKTLNYLRLRKLS